MAWLRLDDGFYTHPKVLKLSRQERWTWVEVLCFCARYDTGGEIPTAISEALPKVNPAFLSKCVDIGLVDTTDEPAFHIHDWKTYNPKDPTNAVRQQRYRSRNGASNGDRNGEVTENVTDENVTTVTPRARASRPVPKDIKPSFLPTPTKAGKEGTPFEIPDKLLKDVVA